MTTTAKNYAAQAEYDLLKVAKMLKKNGLNEDAKMTELMSSFIENSIHFSVPDNGKILDDKLRGITGQSVRLPFQRITIEYHVPLGGVYQDYAPSMSSKRLVMAQEIENNNKEIWIQILAACYSDKHKSWSPSCIGWFMPSLWDSLYTETKVIPQYGDLEGNPKIHGKPFNWLKQICKKREDEVGVENALRGNMHDIAQEMSVLLEFCEALSCSNVTHEPIEKINPAVNARRIRDGKLPIYETRCLVINAGKQSAPSGEYKGNSTHVSPRQHLRRGHIRRLPDKNIWVNSCVVGDKSNGVIDKSYSVTK